MKTVETMTRKELETVVQVVQDALYLIHDDGYFYDPAKEWDPELLDVIAESIISAGLAPAELTPRPDLIARDGGLFCRNNPPMV